MTNYQKAQRPCAKMNGTDMCEIAKKLSADQVKSTAAIFAAEKFVAAKQTPDAALGGERQGAASIPLCPVSLGPGAAIPPMIPASWPGNGRAISRRPCRVFAAGQAGAARWHEEKDFATFPGRHPRAGGVLRERGIAVNGAANRSSLVPGGGCRMVRDT